METALKELTIIDYLGMIVPGTSLVFVFLLDQPDEELWTSMVNSNSALKLIILLTAGYIAGMLLHEIGDILEKILWNCALLNPRCHAAIAIEKNDYSILGTPNKKIGSGTQKSDKQSEVKKKSWFVKIKQIVKNIGCGIVLTALIILSTANPFGRNPLMNCIAWAVSSLLVGFGAYKFEKNLSESVKKRVQENAAIQTLMVGKENEVRRRMFDGFYVMMRNLLLAIVFLSIYIQHGGQAGAFTMKICGALSNDVYRGIYIAAVLTMWVRCFHYAYLKYKYSYEDYLKYLKSI